VRAARAARDAARAMRAEAARLRGRMREQRRVAQGLNERCAELQALLQAERLIAAIRRKLAVPSTPDTPGGGA
jgi:hypothetical protein